MQSCFLRRAVSRALHRVRLLNQLQGAYRRAPDFAKGFESFRECVGHEDGNLFRFLHHPTLATAQRLSILDLLMFNPADDVKAMLGEFDLV